jgi:hypothetical protein
MHTKAHKKPDKYSIMLLFPLFLNLLNTARGRNIHENKPKLRVNKIFAPGQCRILNIEPKAKTFNNITPEI